MGIVAVTSAANHDRILFGQEWLKTKGPAEEVLIIGSTLAAANEITRSLIREKRAAFGYHRLSWGQFASTLARPLLAVQRTVPLGRLGVQAVANRAIHRLSQVGRLGRYVDLTGGLLDLVRAILPDLNQLGILMNHERRISSHFFAQGADSR